MKKIFWATLEVLIDTIPYLTICLVGFIFGRIYSEFDVFPRIIPDTFILLNKAEQFNVAVILEMLIFSIIISTIMYVLEGDASK